MSIMQIFIFVEIFLFMAVVLWVKNLNSKQSRQPSLSKKTIRDLKF